MGIFLATRLLLTFILAVFAVSCDCKKFRPEQLYRIVDRNLGCESGSLITTFEGYSLSTCASACKVDSKCGMFAVENGKVVKRNDSAFIPRGPMRQKCELCKSTNMTSTVLRQGWTTYMEWLKDARFPIMDTDNHTSSSGLEADEMWYIDCNKPDITDYKNGVIVAIWDDKDGFRDLDKVKCMNWGEMDIISGEKPSRLLHIHLEDYRRCPKNYVLTAITASNAAFRNVDKGKCSPLIPELHVDYDHCVTVNSEGQDGGPSDKWRPWRVQCPPSGPHVAVSLNRRRRIHTGLQCCLLKGLDE